MKRNTWKSLATHFWDFVDKTPSCWEWKGGKLTKGYGTIRIGGGRRLAHRVSWIISNGHIPLGMQVLHRCDNPSCVNPKHLFLGTQGDNNRDRASKGRTRVPVGENQNFAKLTGDLVRDIRRRYKKGIGFTFLGREYGVDPGTIRAAVNRKTWKHVDD